MPYKTKSITLKNFVNDAVLHDGNGYSVLLCQCDSRIRRSINQGRKRRFVLNLSIIFGLLLEKGRQFGYKFLFGHRNFNIQKYAISIPVRVETLYYQNDGKPFMVLLATKFCNTRASSLRRSPFVRRSNGGPTGTRKRSNRLRSE